MGYDKFEEYYALKQDFPKFPPRLIDFFTMIVKDIPDSDYSLIPYQYWIPIFKSEAKRKALLMARQLFKTTYFAFRTAHVAVKKKRATTCYVAPDEDKLSTYADQKFRAELLDASPLLRSLIRGNSSGLPGRRSKIQWLNGSFNWQVTDEGAYKKVEGKSGDLIVDDEIQEHEFEAYFKAKEAMSKKIGDEEFGGVGGEYGSAWERLWLDTTQSEWKYRIEGDYIDSNGRAWKDQAWRKQLQFGRHEDPITGEIKHGLIYGPYMKEVCAGDWEETAPENYMFPGWHLSQISACHVPLTMSDAVNLYHQDPSTSIEWKELNYPKLLTIAHVHGWFYKAPRKPISRQDALKTLEPYRYMNFWTPSAVLDIKQTFQDRIRIIMGIDWGSGRTGASETVITIMLKWRGINEDGKFSADRDRYFVIYQERLPYSMSEDMSEAYYAMELFNAYYCDYGSGDMGFGAKQINAMIKGGIDPRDRLHKQGLTLAKFIGCWTRGKPEAEETVKAKKDDEEGNEEATYILRDKTQMIELFIDMVKWKVPHPAYLNEDRKTQERYQRAKLAIPYGDEWKTEYLIKDMTDITRKDLDIDILSTEEIGSQKHKKEYNHPPDSVSSMNHCFIADQHFGKLGGFAGAWSSTRRKPGSRPGTYRPTSPGLFSGTRRRI